MCRGSAPRTAANGIDLSKGDQATVVLNGKRQKMDIGDLSGSQDVSAIEARSIGKG